MKVLFYGGANWLRCEGTPTGCGGSREVTACVTLSQKGGAALCL